MKQSGFMPGVERRLTRNLSSRRGSKVDLCVLHWTAGNSQEGAIRTFTEGKVSAHFVVGKDGHIVQMVDIRHAAWHAGKSSWEGRASCNRYSVGIEAVYRPDTTTKPWTFPPWPDAQIRAMADICRWLEVHPPRIVGHAEVSPGRKVDVQGFPWELFHKYLEGSSP